MTLAERIRNAARLRGLKEGELAASAGISPSGLSKIMNGRVSPRFETVESIVEALGMELAEFFALGDDAAGRALLILRERSEGMTWSPPGARGSGGERVSDEMLSRAIRIALDVLRREQEPGPGTSRD